MSDSEYTDSEYEYDSDDSSEGTQETEVTYTSLEVALAEMTSRLVELDDGLNAMSDVTHALEQPVTSVAISSFVNPRILESAPFRQTKFRLKHAAKELLQTPHHTVTFAELCAAIRHIIRKNPKGLETMWGTKDFLGILHQLPAIIE